MNKTLIKLHKSRSGRFVDYFRAASPANIIFVVILSFVVFYFGNFLLNQFFGTRLIPLGKPVIFMLIMLSIVPVYYIIIRRQGALERQDIFTIVFIAAGTFALIYYLPVLIPEIFTSPSNKALSILNNAYTDPSSPISSWYNISTSIHSAIQSSIPIP